MELKYAAQYLVYGFLINHSSIKQIRCDMPSDEAESIKEENEISKEYISDLLLRNIMEISKQEGYETEADDLESHEFHGAKSPIIHFPLSGSIGRAQVIMNPGFTSGCEVGAFKQHTSLFAELKGELHVPLGGGVIYFEQMKKIAKRLTNDMAKEYCDIISEKKQVMVYPFNFSCLGLEIPKEHLLRGFFRSDPKEFGKEFEKIKTDS